VKSLGIPEALSMTDKVAGEEGTEDHKEDDQCDPQRG